MHTEPDNTNSSVQIAYLVKQWPALISSKAPILVDVSEEKHLRDVVRHLPCAIPRPGTDPWRKVCEMPATCPCAEALRPTPPSTLLSFYKNDLLCRALAFFARGSHVRYALLTAMRNAIRIVRGACARTSGARCFVTPGLKAAPCGRQSIVGGRRLSFHDCPQSNPLTCHVLSDYAGGNAYPPPLLMHAQRRRGCVSSAVEALPQALNRTMYGHTFLY